MHICNNRVNIVTVREQWRTNFRLRGAKPLIPLVLYIRSAKYSFSLFNNKLDNKYRRLKLILLAKIKLLC